MNIYLIGFMGSGKSTLGRLLAHRLGREFLDTDELIEERAGKSIAEIFRVEGEAHFRKLETLCITEVAQQKNLVVALGGGAPIREENWEILKNTGLSIYLRVSPKTVLKRTKDDPDRPLIAGKDRKERLERIRLLLEFREPYYSRADIVVENNGDDPQETIEEILRRLKAIWKSSRWR